MRAGQHNEKPGLGLFIVLSAHCVYGFPPDRASGADKGFKPWSDLAARGQQWREEQLVPLNIDRLSTSFMHAVSRLPAGGNA